jgi:hypothetical protein
MGLPWRSLSFELYQRRLGPGVEGIARGVGLVLVIAPDLPQGALALSDGRVLVVPGRADSVTNVRRACAEIARAVCPKSQAPRVAEELYEFLRDEIDN